MVGEVAPPLEAPRAPMPATPPKALPSTDPQPRPMANPDVQALADRWAVTARRMADEGSLSGLVRELAWQGGLVGVEDGPPEMWRLRIAHESLRSPALKDKLAEALSQCLGRVLHLELQAGDPGDTPARRDAAERARAQASAEAVMREDPLVRSLLQQFSTARLVPGSIKPA